MSQSVPRVFESAGDPPLPMDPGRLWEEFGPQLRGFPARRVPPGVDADDLVQEVFLRVIRSLASLRSTERPEAWLFQIARKALRDSLRVRLRRDGRTDALEVDLPAEPDAAADRAAETELAPCLAAMVGRLAELSDGDHPHVTAGCDTRRRSPPGRHLDLRHEVQGAACVTSRARCW